MTRRKTEGLSTINKQIQTSKGGCLLATLPTALNRQFKAPENQMAILFSEEVPVSIFRAELSLAGKETKTEVPPASLFSTLILPPIARIRFLARIKFIAE